MASIFPPLTRERASQPLPSTLVDGIIASYLCTLIVVAFVLSSDAFLHWFVLPLFVCGVLIATDCVRWLRGRVDILDPLGIVSLLAFHFFFLAPLLHVHWDAWMGRVIPPEDWRVWLGGMAILNAVGLLLYRFYMSTRPKSTDGEHQGVTERVVWNIDKRKFYPLVTLALIVTGAVQVLLFYRYGGVFGYIGLRDQRLEDGSTALSGTGWIVMIAEAFPILALFAFVVYARDKSWRRHWLFIVLAVATFFVLRMLFGGLRGSRSNTIWSMLWAVMLLHVWIRPFSKKFILTGLLVLFIFVYLYGLYKGAGSAAFATLTDLDAQSELAFETGRTVEIVVVGDFGRSDVQAFLLHQLRTPGGDYQYSWGRTYVGAVALLIPRSVWPERPSTKLKEGTEIQYGQGSYLPGIYASSRQYGLAGEAMLNFGFYIVPFTFLILAAALKKVRHWYLTWGSTGDSRFLLVPLLVNLCFALLVYDSDNLIFFQIKNGLIPFMVVLLGSSRTTIEVPVAAEQGTA